MNYDVSVVVSIKDEYDPYLPDCIESLKQQDFPHNYEVLIIKGGNIPEARNL